MGEPMHDLHRPGYHLLPPRLWMNDPNGLIQSGGEYHLFYQHNPKTAVWGNMTWGHAVSRDLVRGRHLPAALHPDQPYDKDGVFSGCMANDNGLATAVCFVGRFGGREFTPVTRGRCAGHTCLTARVYPSRSDSLGVGLFAEGGAARASLVEVWKMGVD